MENGFAGARTTSATSNNMSVHSSDFESGKTIDTPPVGHSSKTIPEIRHGRSVSAAVYRQGGPQAILMITALAGAESCAASLAGSLGLPVEIAASRKLGLAALRRRDYATVIVDESIVDADPAGADLLWKHSGLAVPLQINFALLGCARLGREVRAALARREQEESLAMRAATSSLENELKSTVTGLLLQSELALAEPSVPPKIAGKLQLMVELAGTLRRRLEQPRF
jgi:hypothetical protein